MGKIILNRKKSFLGMLAKYKVFLDEKEIKDISNNEQIELETSDGPHELYLKNAVISTGKSNIIKFNSTSESIIKIIVKSGYYNFSGIKLELESNLSQ